MTTVLMLIGLCVAGGVFAGAKYRTLVLEVQHLRALVATGAALQVQPSAQPALGQLDAVALAGAGDALAKPPSDFRLVMSAIKSKGASRYRIPLGWYVGQYGATLQTAELQGDANHVLITGQSDSGKDNAALGMLLALAHQYGPQRVQFAIVDGKGLDWAGWQHKAHSWLVATDPEHIRGAMDALSSERQRRRDILAGAGVSKWDAYQGDDLPLLVVFVSELLLLENAVGAKNLTAWLNTELTAARAFGIRYILATQTASNFSTQWRSQISLFLAGYQPSPSQDAPNIGLGTNEVDSVPPSRLPAPGKGAAGVFCAVQGADSLNVRTSYISDNQRDSLLATLPNKPATAPQRAAPATADTTLLALLHSGQPLPIAEETCSGAIAHSEGIKAQSVASSSSSVLADKLSVDSTGTALVVAADVVPADEQRRILDAAKVATSRRQISMKLYEATGGQKYTWVQLVCDAAGLLQKGGVA